MLYITVNNITKVWHIGEVLPFTYEECGRVGGIQADGDELMFILNLFEGIPKTEMVVQRWCGSIAATIAANLYGTNGKKENVSR